MKPLSLRTRITLAAAGGLTVLLVAAGFGVEAFGRTRLIASVDAELARRADGMFPPRGPRGPRGPGGPPRGPRGPRREPPEWAPRFIRPGGDEQPYDVASFEQAAKGERSIVGVTLNGEPARLLSLPARDPEGRIDAVVQVPYATGELLRLLAELRTALLALLPFGIGLAALGGASLARTVEAPLRRAVREAGRIDAEGLDARLTASGDDAFAELARTLNGMLDRLAAAFRAQQGQLETERRFAADAAHELRTPLAVIRARAELMETDETLPADAREDARALREGADRLIGTVVGLRALSAGTPEPGVCDLAQIVREIYPAAEGPAELRVEAGESGVRMIISNLLENAARHGGGATRVVFGSAQGSGVLRVQDGGEGVPPEARERVFDRFYRSPEARSRPGSGLGLAIARAAATSAGGDLRLLESATGALFEARLPLAH